MPLRILRGTSDEAGEPVPGEANPAGDMHRRSMILAAVVGLVLFAYRGLAAFNPQPYGTVSIDGPDVELFAPSGGSPVLIFAVAAGLLFSRRSRLARTLGQPPLWLAGVGLLACAAAAGCWADYVGALELLVPSLTLLLLGSGALLGGRRGLAAVAPPALFLAFAIPIPATIVNLLVWPLQLATAESTAWFLRAIGYAPERFGDVVVLAGHSFQVIEACSGMRTIETLIMASALYSILFYRRPTQVVSILLLAPLFGYFVNLVRVLSIIFNPYSKWSSVHTLQGVVMLIAGVLLIVGFDAILRRLEVRSTGAAHASSWKVEATTPVAWPRPAAVALLLLAMGMCSQLIPAWQPGPTPKPRAFRLPGELAQSKLRGLGLDRQFLGSVGVATWLNREYAFSDSSVRIQVLGDDRLNQRGSLISHKTAIPGRGHAEVSHQVVRLTGGGHVDRYVFSNQSQQTLVYHWYEGRAGVGEEVLRNALVLDRGPARRNRWILAVRLSTVATEGASGLAQADARLLAFAEVVRDALK